MNQTNISIIRVGIALVIIMVLGLACGGGDGASKETIAAGKTIYKTYCVACHGVDGKLNLNGAKDFTQSTLALDERKSIITNGKGLMTPFKEVLKPEEIDAVAAYTMELSQGKQ